MNKVILIGRLTKDPELRQTTNGTSTTSFTLAVNRNFTNQSGEREADFINCVAWRKQAENVAKYVTKGSQVAVEGRIQVRTYDDPNGKRNWITEIICDNVTFLDSKASASSEYKESNLKSNPFDIPSDSSAEEDPFASFGDSLKDINDEALPF